MKTRDRLHFYESMLALLDSGAGLSQALDLIKKKSTPLRVFAEKAHQETLNGGSIITACQDFPEEEKSLLDVGEKSGELVEIFRFLVEKLEREAELVKFVISKMWQPAFLFIFALFLFPSINCMIGQKSSTYWLMATAVPLGLISLIIFWLLYKWTLDVSFRKKLLLNLLPVPFFGKTILLYESYKFFWTYYIFVRAGIEIGSSLSSLRSVIFTPNRIKALEKAFRNKTKGDDIHSSFKGPFPVDLVERWEISFHAGKEEEMLKVLSSEVSSDFKRRMDLISRWIPKIIYALVVAFVFYQLLGFFQLRLEQIDLIDQY